jgi:hypothetical protein
MSPTRYSSRRSRCRSAASGPVLKRSSRIGRGWTVSGSSSPSRSADSGRACCSSSRSRSFTRCARIVARAWRCIRRSISSTSVARMATSVISTSGRPGRKYGCPPLSQSRCSRRSTPTGSRAWPCLEVIRARPAFSRPGRVPGPSRRARWSVCARVSGTPGTVTRPAPTSGSRRAIRVSTRTSQPR